MRRFERYVAIGDSTVEGLDDPDGRGGMISANDLVNGTAPVRRLLDIDGTPISEPVLLDGKGGVLGDKKDPVYITYAKYLEVPFAPLGL